MAETKKPAAKKPAAKKPAAKKPAAKKPVAKKSVTKKMRGGGDDCTDEDITAKAMTKLGRTYDHNNESQLTPKRDALRKILAKFLKENDHCPEDAEIMEMVNAAIATGAWS